MQLSTATVFVFIVNVLERVQSELTIYTENVCEGRKTHFERTTVWVKKPHEVKQQSWCWSIKHFFRCEKTITIWMEVLEPRMVPVSSPVLMCCKGYDEVGGKCVPICIGGCVFGKCVKPNVCDCYHGFYNARCSKECPKGFWGINCVNECKCSNGGYCQARTGCVCQPGWTGERCQIPTTTEATTTEATTTGVITSTISTTPETLLQFARSDTSSTEDTTQPPLLSTIHSISETSVEVYQSIDESTTTNAISVKEIFKKSGLLGQDSTLITEGSKESKTTTEKMDESSFKVIAIEEMNPSEMEEFDRESAEGIISTDSTISATITTSTETSRMKIEREEEIKSYFMANETDFRDDLDSTNAETQEISNTISPVTPNELIITRKKTNSSSFTVGIKDVDNNKTENFISEERRNSHKETIFTFLHFLPSLSVLSAVSFLIIIIAARWVFMNHRKKTRMLVVVAEKGNIFRSEDQVKFQAENLFWVNPVYMSDVDLNNTRPVLQTFKPVDKPLTSKERTVL